MGQLSVSFNTHNAELLRRETPDFIIALNLWLLYISRFNTVNYRIVTVLQEILTASTRCR